MLLQETATREYSREACVGSVGGVEGTDLAAVEERLEKLGGQIGRDRAVVSELEEFRERYHRRAKGTPPWRQSEALRLYRWMMEEYRVSLFAQPLGTRVPVSSKRLNRQWEAC